MKRFLFFAAAALGMFAAFSCTKEEKEEILTLNSTTYTVSNAGAVQTISFTASTDWTMVSEAEWISLDKASGIAGPATVTMTIAANTDYTDRSGKVVLTMADKVTEFKINQTELKDFGTAASIEIDAKEQEVTIGVKANVEYTVTVDEAAKDWIEVVKTKAAPTEGTIVLHVSANTGLAPRTGMFTIAADGTSQEYTITQAAEYIPATEASALYLRNRQSIYNSEMWAYTTFGQFAVILKTEEGEEIRLVLNNARTDEMENELGIGKALIDGTYAVDATATNADMTFAIKSTDGHEEYYTTILSGQKEISIVDGEINVSTEDGKVTITAILVDAAEALHRYSFQGALEVVDDSYGANADTPNFYNTYNTYYTTKANEWVVSLYFSEDGKNPEEYVRYITFHLYGQAGEFDGKDLPEGTFNLAELAADATLPYLNGITIANPMTFDCSAYTADMNQAVPDYSKGGSVTVKKNDDGTYSFDFDITFKGIAYDYETWELVETGTVVGYKHSVKKVYVPDGKMEMSPCPDGDIVATSIFNSKYIGLWFGDAMNNGGNSFVLGFSGSAINYNYEIYLAINTSGDWTFEKNFAGKYCTTPIPAGRYEFSAEGAVGSVMPVKYGSALYCYVKNYYTGTQMKICGGYVDIAADKLTYNLQLKAGDQIYTMTGSHPAEMNYSRDYSSRAKNLKLYTVE